MNTAHGSLLIVDDDRQNRLLLAARLKPIFPPHPKR
jgi:hypothetical protein